ncbi:hypothetical protein PTKIN_Ptkin06aG0103700 [Pterospermum kingtungense]
MDPKKVNRWIVIDTGIIWKATVAPKVKVFWWRIFHNIIPVNVVLLSKSLHVGDECAVCGCHGEDVIHVLFSCALSVAAWSELQVDISVLDVANLDWTLVLEFWKGNCGVEVAMYLGWCLWSNRNGCLHKLVCKSASVLALKARKHCQEFMEANSKPEHVPLRQSTSWIPPMIGFNKLNVDVGFEGLTGRAVYGMVVRD